MLVTDRWMTVGGYRSLNENHSLYPGLHIQPATANKTDECKCFEEWCYSFFTTRLLLATKKALKCIIGLSCNTKLRSIFAFMRLHLSGRDIMWTPLVQRLHKDSYSNSTIIAPVLYMGKLWVTTANIQGRLYESAPWNNICSMLVTWKVLHLKGVDIPKNTT